MMKMRRREKWWFHAIRGMNLWAFRYWWLFLLLFVGAIVLFYYQCCPEKEENCAEWKTAIEKTRLALDASENCCNCSALGAWEDPDEFAQEIEVPLPENTVPCDALTESGGEGTYTNNHWLGSLPGVIVISYEMLNQPDEMNVYYNGQLVASTGGFVSGRGTLSFNYEAIPGEPEYCVVEMKAPEPRTLWSYVLNCQQ
jgi:hypothetical protein